MEMYSIQLPKMIYTMPYCTAHISHAKFELHRIVPIHLVVRNGLIAYGRITRRPSFGGAAARLKDWFACQYMDVPT
jgi:hypothetical protein